ncbi:hypothetical protein LCGC14_1730280 [marine sediment metagenome]|uniref:Uncharacterized protein n=1 Tax=marine sediment metagenome TaxID=412755 RepID=A0A0F9K9I3_9ZZZZ|nr:MAG: hypothetical protein Lokiarch_15630 [Candidatus Lokiarchaeum sp. GC14_75]
MKLLFTFSSLSVEMINPPNFLPQDSHAREERAIKFYGEAAANAASSRVKEIFQAFVQVDKVKSKAN